MENPRKEEGAPLLEAGRADGDEAIAILTHAVMQLQGTVEELAGQLARMEARSGDEPMFATPEAVAKRLGIGRDTVYRMVNAKVNPMPHVREGNRRYIDLDEAYRYMKGREIA